MNRRDFSKKAGMGALAFSSIPLITLAMNSGNTSETEKKVPLGVCNHSLRAMRPNAIQLINYAIEQKLDSVIFNTLRPFESLEDSYLKKVKELADAND